VWRGCWSLRAVGWTAERRLRDLLDVDALPFIERVGGIQNDPVVDGKAVQDFERSAEVAANDELPKMEFVIGINDNGPETFGAE
jgi:hypothetical protein